MSYLLSILFCIASFWSIASANSSKKAPPSKDYQGRIDDHPFISDYCKSAIQKALPALKDKEIQLGNQERLMEIFKKGFQTGLQHERACQEVALSLHMNSYPAPSLSTKQSLENEAHRVHFDEMVLVTHQIPDLQIGTSDILRKHHKNTPKIMLASKVYPIHDSSLATQAQQILLSELGDFDHITPPPSANRVYAYGGYCEMCLHKSLQRITQATYNAGYSSIEIILSSNYVYTHQGSKRSIRELTEKKTNGLSRNWHERHFNISEDALGSESLYTSNPEQQGKPGHGFSRNSRHSCSSFLNPHIDLHDYIKDNFGSLVLQTTRSSTVDLDDGVLFQTSKEFTYKVIVK